MSNEPQTDEKTTLSPITDSENCAYLANEEQESQLTHEASKLSLLFNNDHAR